MTKTEILLKLPVYSIDRLIYEEIIANENEYSRTVRHVVDTFFSETTNNITQLSTEGNNHFASENFIVHSTSN